MLIDRGYDQKGWPFAPCGLLARPNGFDKKHQRLTFCCFKQCLKLRPKALENLHNKYNIAMCPHIRNRTGFSKHMYVKEHPRLINEIPRGSKRYNTIKKFRSASERSNSTIKEDLKILEKPRVLNGPRANILAQIAAIALLLTCRDGREHGGNVHLILLPESPTYLGNYIKTTTLISKKS